jgi:hypothetical protein
MLTARTDAEIAGIARQHIESLAIRLAVAWTSQAGSRLTTAFAYALATLSYRQLYVIGLRFGTLDGSTYTYEEISHALRTTPRAVKSAETRGLCRLRRNTLSLAAVPRRRAWGRGLPGVNRRPRSVKYDEEFSATETIGRWRPTEIVSLAHYRVLRQIDNEEMAKSLDL